MGMKLGKWRSRTNLTFVATNLHQPLLITETKIFRYKYMYSRPQLIKKKSQKGLPFNHNLIIYHFSFS